MYNRHLWDFRQAFAEAENKSTITATVSYYIVNRNITKATNAIPNSVSMIVERTSANLG